MQKNTSVIKWKDGQWSLKKWGLLTGIVFLLQILFFASFLNRSTQPDLKKSASPQIVITAQKSDSLPDSLAPYINALDPFIFSYSSRNGVTSPVWKARPQIEYDPTFFSPLSSTIAPENFYFLNDMDTLLQSSHNARGSFTKHTAVSSGKLFEPDGFPTEPVSSTIQLSKDIRNIFKIPEISVPSITYDGILQDTEIEATIGEDGRILSAVLHSSSGLNKADTLALEIVQELRLLPIDTPLDPKQNIWENFKISRILFHWSTTPLNQ